MKQTSRKNRIIRFRVCEEDFQKIRKLSGVKGYETMSGYIRDLALHKHSDVEKIVLKHIKSMKRLVARYELKFENNDIDTRN